MIANNLAVLVALDGKLNRERVGRIVSQKSTKAMALELE